MADMSNVKIFHDPTTIVLSGGGMHGFTLLGALSYLKDKNYLDCVQTYIGTSIGGIIGYLLSIGYSPIDCVIYFQKTHLGKSLSQLNLISMLNGTGASSFTPLQNLLEKMTIDKIGQFITLNDLKEKLGKRLVLCTYNLSENKPEYLTPETHPTLPCITALRMTSNLPFIFEDFKYMGSYYIDGGVYDNFPIDQAITGEDEKVLGLALDTGTRYNKNSEESNFIEYIFHLILIPINRDIETRIKKAQENGQSIIKLTKNNFSRFIDFSMGNRETLDLFSDGYNDAKKYYEEI